MEEIYWLESSSLLKLINARAGSIVYPSVLDQPVGPWVDDKVKLLVRLCG